jgi:hypothetical protein
MELNGQLNTPAALHLEEGMALPIEQKAGWTTDWVLTFWRKDKYLALTGK